MVRLVRGVAVSLVALVLAPWVFAAPASAVDTVPGTQMSVSEWNRQMRQRVFGVKQPSGYISRTAGPTANTAARRVLAAKRTQTGLGGPLKVTQMAPEAQAASKFGRIFKGAGTAALAVSAFDVSYKGTGWVMESLFDVPSNGPICDFSQLVGADCWLGAGPEYVANSDVGNVEPGWTPTNNYSFAGASSLNSHHYTSGQYTVNVEPITFGQTSSVRVVIAQNATGSCVKAGTNNYVEWPAVNFRVIFKSPNGGVEGTNLRSISNDMYGACDKPAKVLNDEVVTVPSGYAFDHLQGYLGARGDYWPTQAKPEQSLTSPFGLPSWYPEGHENRPPDLGSDPARQWVTDYLCSVGGPGVITSDPWVESSPEWPAPPMPTCDEGALTKVKIVQRTPGLEDVVFLDWEATPGLGEFEDQFPECLDGSCILELHRVDDVTGKKLACFDNPGLCLGWFENPDKEDLFECTYGTHSVPLSDCNVYGPTFEPDLRTRNDVPLGDPDTGLRPTPTPDDPPVVVDPDTPPMDNSCPPPFTWTALFNPWYYYKATVCGLQAAFVPRSMDQNVTRLKDTWDASSVGQILGAVGSLGAAFVLPDNGACGVLYDTEIEAFGGLPMSLNTCATPWPNFAVVRDVSGFAMLAGAVILSVRMASRLLRVDPVGSSEGD